jgi:hypothetical protein
MLALSPSSIIPPLLPISLSFPQKINSAILTNAVSLSYFALLKIAKALNCVT